MKKARKALAVITSLVMFACASLATMSTDAAIVTDNTRSEFDSGEETVDVRILFNFDAKILDKVKGEAHQKAEELSKEYYDSLDVLKYTELERLSMQREYFNVNYERLSKELMEKAKKDLAKPVLEDIGVDITEDIEYPNYGMILCELNKDQLSKAENNDTIKSVSVDKDWDNENYIGTPSIYPVFTGTTTTASNTTYTTTTTTSFSVSSSLVTTLEYYGNDMFTDIIKDIDDFTIQFENHGKYRFLSSAIKDQLIHYKIGDEITIRFEYLRVNDTDTPRIDNILMLKCTNIPLGDVNRDRLIDAIDASIILANYAKYSTSSAKPAESELAEQDVNGDGFIDAVDASMVLSYYAYTSVGGQFTFSEYLNNSESTTVWNGKTVSSELYTLLSKNTDEKTVIAVSPRFNSTEKYKYNGKTIAEYREEVSDNNLLNEKLHQILLDGDKLKYGEILYTTGTPEGAKWSKELYEQKSEFYGEEFLAKYIVNGEFLKNQVEADIADFSTEAHTALTDAFNAYQAYKKVIIQEAIEQLKQQNIKYDYNEESVDLIINVTAEEFKDLVLENISCYYLASTASDDVPISYNYEE